MSDKLRPPHVYYTNEGMNVNDHCRDKIRHHNSHCNRHHHRNTTAIEADKSVVLYRDAAGGITVTHCKSCNIAAIIVHNIIIVFYNQLPDAQIMSCRANTKRHLPPVLFCTPLVRCTNVMMQWCYYNTHSSSDAMRAKKSPWKLHYCAMACDALLCVPYIGISLGT